MRNSLDSDMGTNPATPGMYARGPHAYDGRPGTSAVESSNIIKVKGLPYRATKEQLLDFFKGYKVQSLAFVREVDGRTSGLAFVVFETAEEAAKALSLSGKYVGDRFVKLLQVSKEEMDEQVEFGTVAIPGYKGNSAHSAHAKAALKTAQNVFMQARVAGHQPGVQSIATAMSGLTLSSQRTQHMQMGAPYLAARGSAANSQDSLTKSGALNPGTASSGVVSSSTPTAASAASLLNHMALKRNLPMQSGSFGGHIPEAANAQQAVLQQCYETVAAAAAQSAGSLQSSDRLASMPTTFLGSAEVLASVQAAGGNEITTSPSTHNAQMSRSQVTQQQAESLTGRALQNVASQQGAATNQSFRTLHKANVGTGMQAAASIQQYFNNTHDGSHSHPVPINQQHIIVSNAYPNQDMLMAMSNMLPVQVQQSAQVPQVQHTVMQGQTMALQESVLLNQQGLSTPVILVQGPTGPTLATFQYSQPDAVVNPNTATATTTSTSGHPNNTFLLTYSQPQPVQQEMSTIGSFMLNQRDVYGHQTLVSVPTMVHTGSSQSSSALKQVVSLPGQRVNSRQHMSIPVMTSPLTSTSSLVMTPGNSAFAQQYMSTTHSSLLSSGMPPSSAASQSSTVMSPDDMALTNLLIRQHMAQQTQAGGSGQAGFDSLSRQWS